MYVVIGEATIDATRREESLTQVNDVLIPLLSNATGFVNGYWLRNADGSKGMSVLIFDTEANAVAASHMRPPDPLEDPPVHGVTLNVYEVVATA